MATVVLRWGQFAVPEVTPAFHVFCRFLLGWVVTVCLLLGKRKRPRPAAYGWIVGRVLSNVLAVWFFYECVVATSVAEANILNMTYPVFIVVFSWIGFGQSDRLASWLTIVAFTGVVLVMLPEDLEWRVGNVWGLASGFTAAFAIISLNRARQHNDTDTLLLFVFGLGTLLMAALFSGDLFWPNLEQAQYLLGSAGLSVIGQYGLTVGFRYVTPVEGSVISSTRILLAAALGPFLLQGEWLSWRGWMGACLIFLANVMLARRLWQVSSARGN